MEALGLTLLGVGLGWLVTHLYHRQSSRNPPEWAQPLIEKLPDSPVSDDRLIALYHEALAEGRLSPDPLFGIVACPRCGEPQESFEGGEAVENDRAYRWIRCPSCGWSDDTEL